MPLPGLLSLPNELILQVVDELETCKAFRATCKQINFCVAPRLLSRIVIDIQEERIDVSISQLEALATRSTSAGEHVRIVDIRHLSPRYNPGFPGLAGRFIFDGSVEERFVLKVDWACRKIHELLPAALSTLQAAEALIWSIHAGDLEEAVALVSEFSVTLPSSSSTAITSSEVSSSKLRHASRLTKLLVVGCPNQTRITEIIGASSNLDHLDLYYFCGHGDTCTPTLHGALGAVPRERPLRLRHLGIASYFVRFDAEVLPHLRLLESVEFRYIALPIEAEDQSEYTQEEVETSDRFSSSTSDIWEVIRREGIELKSITAPVDESLLGYLSVACNIEKLTLHEAENDIHARNFFAHILPRHTKTLTSLNISAVPKGSWCFGTHNIKILLECTLLTELSVTLNTFYTNEGYEVPVADLVAQVINMTVALPHLRQLGLFCVRRELIVGSMEATLWRKPTSEHVCEAVTSFSPVNPALHPRIIVVGHSRGSRFHINCSPDGAMKYIQQVQ